MKVLFFVDTHGSSSRIRRLIDKSREADLIVCAGDFTIFESDLDRTLQELDRIGKPVLIIHGNHETASSVEIACETLPNLHFIHKTFYIMDDVIVYGYGGGGFASRDEGFKRNSEQFITELKHLSEQNNKKYKLVLVTHGPPFGTRLDDLGQHVGNQSITEFIIANQPVVAISGHIHETAGMEDKINNSRLINPGWNGIIIDL